jgi:hypothetical protein
MAAPDLNLSHTRDRGDLPESCGDLSLQPAFAACTKQTRNGALQPGSEIVRGQWRAAVTRWSLYVALRAFRRQGWLGRREEKVVRK